MHDEELMKLVVKLAVRGTGLVSPNPRVGALIVKDGKIIGKGWHKSFGGLHAEIEAINSTIGADLTGATMYVNLEPCTHFGKTPPCVPAIIEKKFARVVVGMLDPNPEVNGSGIKALQDAGIQVDVGICEEDCKWLNRFFSKYIITGSPYIVAKVAQSLDGCIATAEGQSKWISSEESRKRVHSLRSEVDAVLVGKNTIIKDSPLLTVRYVSGRNPKRIILDTNLSLPLGLQDFKEAIRTHTIVCCKKEAAYSRKAETLKVAGVKILPVEIDNNGKLDLWNAFNELSKAFNISSILVEGGSVVLSSLAAMGLLDEIQIFLAPIIIGKGQSSFKDFKISRLEEALKFNYKAVVKSDVDLHIIATKK